MIYPEKIILLLTFEQNEKWHKLITYDTGDASHVYVTRRERERNRKEAAKMEKMSG